MPPQQQGLRTSDVEAKIPPQQKEIQKPRASSMLTSALESSILAKKREQRKDPSNLTSSIDIRSQSSGTVSEILRLKGDAVGAGSGAHRVGLSNKVRIAPLHARLNTPSPPPPPIFKPHAKPKRKEDDSDIDSEEEYEGLTAAQIAEKREVKRKAAWYSP